MLGGYRHQEEAKSDDPYEIWKHPIEEEENKKIQKIRCFIHDINICGPQNFILLGSCIIP